MKELTFQTDKRHSKTLQKYGCLFKCIAFYSDKDISVEEQNILWDILCRRGDITGDLNHDGDVDDNDESVIINHDAVAEALGADIKYIPKHFDADIIIPDDCVAIGCFKWKGTHFVCIDKNKTVIYDPTPDSNTIKYGYLQSIRLYKKKTSFRTNNA